jgi:antitoxin component YwqK of YwqJK toxin-antitoxin module
MSINLPEEKFVATKHPNGNWKSQNFCENSTRTGYQVTWYENGQMKSAGDFNKGKPVGLHTLWFENGNKRAEINYKDGRRDGGFVFWHSNSQVKFQGSYSSGEVIGTWAKYYLNGQKYKETDTIKGERLYWHENGQMKSRLWRIFYGAYSENSNYKPIRNWNTEGKLIDSESINLIELKRYKGYNTIEREAYIATECYAYFDKNGIKEHDIDCRWEWDSDIHCEGRNDECEEKDYLVTINRFFDSKGNVDASIKFYLDGEIDGKPYAWCFYNSEDSLVYKYIINPETHNDINLYYELLKIDNKELNSLLLNLKYIEIIAVFDSYCSSLK